jgi:hypothetical protein
VAGINAEQVVGKIGTPARLYGKAGKSGSSLPTFQAAGFTPAVLTADLANVVYTASCECHRI